MIKAWRGGVNLIMLSFAVYFAALTSAQALELITEQEAALPTDELPPLVYRGSPTRRPNVAVVSPAPSAGVVRSPFQFIIRYRAFGGAQIDVDSIVVTYKKIPMINLNQRIARFITANGIEISDAEAPPGIHMLRIELKDTEGRVAGVDFGFRVAK